PSAPSEPSTEGEEDAAPWDDAPTRGELHATHGELHPTGWELRPTRREPHSTHGELHPARWALHPTRWGLAPRSAMVRFARAVARSTPRLRRARLLRRRAVS